MQIVDLQASAANSTDPTPVLSSTGAMLPTVTGLHPRLRSHTRRRKSGKVVSYYFYDRRPDGEPDVPLGSNFADALKRWEELHHRAPRIAGTLQEAFERWRTERLPLYGNKETRKSFTRQLRRLEPVFGESRWDDIELPHLVGYLERRRAKTQGNREMSLLSIVWNWARTVGLTRLPFPAAGMERSRWKNREKPRRFEVTDALFAAVYAHADQVLRDCMDLATATAMRLTDCRTILLPRNDVLHVEASKTGKAADFDLTLSDVLPELLQRRRGLKAGHLMLLSTHTGRPITAGMLRSRWDTARAAAAEAAAGLAQAASGDERDDLLRLASQIRAMYLRDMRKRASDLASDLDAAAALLQHDDKRLTALHYRTRAPVLKPVR